MSRQAAAPPICLLVTIVRLIANSVVQTMASREVSLFLKYPGPSHVLQRLQHSFLECVVEYKSGSEGELQTLTPAELHSTYQLKGTATLVDDEIVVQFKPKHSGVHTVRIFADTRELCRPVAFIVTRGCEVESIPIDHPVKSTTFAHPPPTLSEQQSEAAESTQPSYPSSMLRQRTSTVHPPPEQREDREHHAMRGFTSDSSIAVRRQDPFQRASYVSTGTNRPPSMSPDEAAFAGDLFTTKPEQNSFDDLYASKKAGYPTYGTTKGLFTVNHSTMVTPATFRMLRKDIDLQLSSHIKGKKMKKR